MTETAHTTDMLRQPGSSRGSEAAAGYDWAAALTDSGLEVGTVMAVIERAFAEDLALGPDVTSSATIPAEALGTAELVSRAAGTLAGVPVAAAAAAHHAGQVGARLEITARHGDGDRVDAGAVILEFTGPVRVLLTAERTMLNLIGQLSGVATATSQWVDAVAGTDATIRDTRKTVPGLRQLQKYAVRCGGGQNHRMGLGDAALIKDNHVAAAGSVTAAYAAVRKQFPDVPVEVEVDTLDQAREAIAAGADLILLDNMDTDTMRAAVELGRRADGAVRFEASGGLSLGTAAQVAATGVDHLAIGALTHSAAVLDLALDLR